MRLTAAGTVANRFQLSPMSLKVASWYTPPIYTQGVQALQLLVTTPNVTLLGRPLWILIQGKDEVLSDPSSLLDWTNLHAKVPLAMAAIEGTNKTHNIWLGPNQPDVDDPDNYVYWRRTPIPPVFRIYFFIWVVDPAAYTYSAWLNVIA